MGILLFAATWMNLQGIKVSDISQKSDRERQILYGIIYMYRCTSLTSKKVELTETNCRMVCLGLGMGRTERLINGYKHPVLR